MERLPQRTSYEYAKVTVSPTALRVDAIDSVTNKAIDTVTIGTTALTSAYIASSRQRSAVYINGLVKQQAGRIITRSAGRTVYLQRFIGGHWANVLSRRTDANGQMAVGFIQNTVYSYRLYVLATATATAAISATTPGRRPTAIPPEEVAASGERPTQAECPAGQHVAGPMHYRDRPGNRRPRPCNTPPAAATAGHAPAVRSGVPDRGADQHRRPSRHWSSARTGTSIRSRDTAGRRQTGRCRRPAIRHSRRSPIPISRTGNVGTGPVPERPSSEPPARSPIEVPATPAHTAGVLPNRVSPRSTLVRAGVRRANNQCCSSRSSSDNRSAADRLLPGARLS